MNNPEQDLIQELMRLTGRSQAEASAFLETLKKKMLSEAGMTPVSEDKKYTEEDYPHFLPSEDIRKYIMRITLKDIRPSIWRKIEVPSNITLRHLAELIIDVMGWSGYHLNQFRKGVDSYFEPFYQRDGDMEGFSHRGIRHYNQEDYTIAQVLADKGKHIIFEYDFGDSWEHEVRLSSIDEYEDGEQRTIRFISGKRACPPEDCGGIWGYEELCDIHQKRLAGKRLTKDEREHLAWYAGEDELFDPELLDLETCADAADRFND
jgi:hypothetical protein